MYKPCAYPIRAINEISPAHVRENKIHIMKKWTLFLLFIHTFYEPKCDSMANGGKKKNLPKAKKNTECMAHKKGPLCGFPTNRQSP